MIAYTVTERAGSTERIVRVEAPEHWTLDDRRRELEMALGESERRGGPIRDPDADDQECGCPCHRNGVGCVCTCAATDLNAPDFSVIGLAHSMIATAVEAVPGVIFCVATELDDVTEVWVLARPDARPAARSAATTAMSQYLTPARRRVLRDVFGAAELEAARLDERIKIPAYDTKPFRDRIRADREVFAEIEGLTRGAPGNVQIANQLAKRAMAEVVPA